MLFPSFLKVYQEVPNDLVEVQVLVDPVCLMTCYPDLLQNFIYCQPNWSRLFSHVGLMDALRFVCSRDLLIAEVRFPVLMSFFCPAANVHLAYSK